MCSQGEVDDIFRFEYHPVEKREHRIRVVFEAATGLRVVTERRRETGWEQVAVEDIGYFEYSDEDMRRGELPPAVGEPREPGDPK